MHAPLFALVDGNNFYWSCETSMRPALRGLPGVVLSNNDGCAIARSNEAKDIGIKMGAPWFQLKHLQESTGLVALSANFELYGEISDRMMSIVAALGHRQEIYSIDESFIDLTGVPGDLTKRARAIRARVNQWIGIPTCIGIAPTKTLAKLANHIAKQAERKPGSYPAELAQVADLSRLPEDELDALLAATSVGEVWGVGRRIGEQLKAQGVATALDLKRMSPAAARAGWSVIFERTVRELQGESCVDLEDVAPAKQEIACTRSFGSAVRDLDELTEAVSEFSARAAQKLRRQSGVTSQILVFIRTSPFRQTPQYSRSLVIPLRRPTADSADITSAAVIGLKAIFKPGFDYAKAGVMLLDIDSSGTEQFELEFECEASNALAPRALHVRSRLMAALDAVNERYGGGTLKLASAGSGTTPRNWTMKQALRTPAYTTRWEDMPVVRA
jgi:DNA polymerase V